MSSGSSLLVLVASLLLRGTALGRLTFSHAPLGVSTGRRGLSRFQTLFFSFVSSTRDGHDLPSGFSTGSAALGMNSMQDEYPPKWSFFFFLARM